MAKTSPISVRPDDQVKVLGQQAPGQHAQGDLDRRVGQGFEEGLGIAVLAEDLLAGVAAIKNRVARVANRGSGSTRPNDRVVEPSP